MSLGFGVAGGCGLWCVSSGWVGRGVAPSPGCERLDEFVAAGRRGIGISGGSGSAPLDGVQHHLPGGEAGPGGSARGDNSRSLQ